MSSRLLEIANNYSSAEEFKAKDLPNFLLARKARIIHKLFPPVIEEPVKSGIFNIYNYEKLIYIGYCTEDAKLAMENYIKDNELITAKSYKIYYVDSTADVKVLYSYLVARGKPVLNPDVTPDILTFKIPGAIKRLGKPHKGKL